MSKRLVYVLNSYSPVDVSHFWHVLELLEAIADRGIEVRVVIEKSSGRPEFRNERISVEILPPLGILRRYWGLYRAVRSAVRGGYSAVFTRISAPSAVVATVACLGTAAKSYYWQSGTVHDFDATQPFGLKKLRWYVTTHLPFRLLLRILDGFATGPEMMLDYYRERVGVP